MTTPDWVAAVEHIGTPLSGVLLYVLGRATKGGANQKALDDACDRIAEMKKQLEQHESILAVHTKLHEGYVDMQKDLQSIGRKLDWLCGKFGVQGNS